MADENNVVKQVVWSEVFSFPHIFKSFKMAIQPGKLVLAVLALALIFGGGYALDWIWCAAGQTVPVAPRGQDTAILSHAGMDSDNYSESEFVAGFFDTRLERAADLLVAVKNDERSLSWWVAKGGVFATPAFRERLDEYNKDVPGDDPQNTTEVLAAAKKEGDDYDDLIGQAEEALDQEFAKVEEILYDGKDELPDVLEDELDKQIADLSKQDEFTEEQAEEMREGFERNIAAIDRAFTDRQVWFNQQVRTIRGDGVFESFLAYETNCLNNAMMALWNLNIRGGLCNYQALVEGRGTAPVTADLATGLPAPSAVRQANEQNGFLYYVLMAVEGFRWMSLQHWLFAIIVLVWTLAIVACFGGAISRMTALHFAREES
ncbi:MAG: hypothetical protein KGY81_02075, partial [Phycisphaerae bacterium]|nr:hypothetical protein [Phycisphaerae bacterium]